MADELDQIKKILGGDQGNIRPEYNNGNVGLNMDQSVNQIKPGTLTYALNAAVENFDANSVNYQNEQGNELCLTFPNEFILIGTHIIQEKNKHIFFITNPTTLECQIGYMENNDCIYHTLVNAPCLNFNINHPIHKVVHKITNCSIEIYWTDGYNPRRYLDINKIPYTLQPGSLFCSPLYTNEVDCNQLKMQPNFTIPELNIVDVITGGGTLISGTYQFAIQYADPAGNAYTSYYSVTNPTPIADIFVTTINFNYPVGKSITIGINNLDITGQFQYFNLAVIKTINDITSVELVGTYFIDGNNLEITYTGQNVTQQNLTIADIFEKYPYYDIAQDLTAVQDVLVWDNLTSIDRLNYQHIANRINLLWETYKLPADENYSDELNATNLRGYLRDEVYAFEIVFLLKNGKQTDGFHIPGRELSVSERNYPNITTTDPDFIGEPEPGTNYSPYWKIYNTGSVIGNATGTNIGNATPYEYGEFAYWESTEKYPCNVDVWGDLADTPIRHHKFPDVLVSPHYESAMFVDSKSMVMQNDVVYPIGVKVDTAQISALISSSLLTQDQRSEIVGYKIVRGNRGTNKSIVAKGILRNVGKYTRETQDFYYPNYPYNDLEEDPFLNERNNSYLDSCKPWLVLCYGTAEGETDVIIEYVDCNDYLTKQLKVPYILKDPALGVTTDNVPIREFCSSIKPNIISGTGTIVPANYDVILVPAYQNVHGYYAISENPWIYNNNSLTTVAYRKFILGSADRTYDAFNYYFIVEVDENVYVEESPGTLALSSSRMESPVQPLETIQYRIINVSNAGTLNIEYVNGVLSQGTVYKGRRSTLTCGSAPPLKGMTTEASQYRQVFNSPETSFGQPFLGQVLKLENVMFGRGRAHFVQVKNNAKYKLLSREAQIDALNSSAEIAAITTGQFNATAMFTAYQAYLTIYINGITRKNYAYSYNSRANYDYSADIENGLGIKQRPIDITRYLIPVVQSVGEPGGININNYQRESSVFIKTKEEHFGNTLSPLPYPSKTDSLLDANGNSIVTDKSRLTISGSDVCDTPTKEQDISVVSYYASMKNIFNNQWGQMYSYDTIDTGYQIDINSNTVSPDVVFGGDTFISRFAFKTKIPFFIDNRVNAPDDSDVFYDEIGNVGYPKYWHSARSILENYLAGSTLMANIISYKAHNFDCPNNPAAYNTPSGTGGVSGTLRTFYNGYFYLFAYGIPNFYCESSYNVDLRQAFNNREGDFWPHVSTGIPDDWVQESYVPIAQDNSYYYNITYSKQNKENVFTHLPADWANQFCYTYYPFRAIYSDAQETNADNRVNNWLSYGAISSFDFPQNYGNLISLDGIQNKAVLARFENKSLMYNNLLTVDTSNPQAAYLGNPNLFAGAPPIDFAETDLGYVGSQNKFLLKIPQGQITVDAKRGQVFLISGTQAVDLSGFGSGMNRFFTDHLAFEILRYFPPKQIMVDGQLITIPGVDVDNNYTGIGLHGVYDSKFDRIILSKLDYIPIDKDVKYDSVTKEFYVEYTSQGAPFRTQVYLNDPDYFCNKSWTISFNFNTKTWVSFHSYIPNFYIAENNFFYSGINGCCTDIDADFTMLIGENTGKFDPIPEPAPIPVPPTTSSTTTIFVDCTLEGEVIITDCILDGEGIITVPPTPTTTICQRSGVNAFSVFYSGYEVDSNPPINFSGSAEEACNALIFTRTSNPLITLTSFSGMYQVLEEGGLVTGTLIVGAIVYYDATSLDCTLVPDGWYFTQESWITNLIYHIVGGVVTEIEICSCTVDTTTTLVPIINECCGVLFNSPNDNISLVNYNNSSTAFILDIPDYVQSTAIALTQTKFWSIDTDIKEWDITLSPFSAVYNRTIALPVGFTTSTGVFAKDVTTLIAVDDSVSPQDIVEIDVTNLIATSITIFSLPADRTTVSNILYTTTGKLLIVTQDDMTSDYYLSEYDYATGILDLEIDITISAINNPVSLFECDCNIYIVNNIGEVYLLDKISPYPLVLTTTLDIDINTSTQVGSCITSAIINPTTTTTTTI
jgi:hypothetical protein